MLKKIKEKVMDVQKSPFLARVGVIDFYLIAFHESLCLLDLHEMARFLILIGHIL